MNAKQIVRTALAAAVALAGAAAQAGVLGSGVLAVTSLGIVNVATGTPVTTGFNVISDSRTGTAGADYNGVAGTGVGNSSITLGNSANVDVGYRCAGACGAIGGIYAGGGGPENNITTHIAPPAAANYALSDMFINGSALTSSVSGLTRADASATGANNQGGSSATIQNSASVLTTFQATDNFTGAIALTANAYVRAFVDPANPPSNASFASGSIGWNVTITDLTAGTQIRWSPNELNVGLFSAASTQNQSYSFNSALNSAAQGITMSVIAGHTYQLVISQSSGATVSEIPEPGSLALVGLALVGLSSAAAARRRRVK